MPRTDPFSKWPQLYPESLPFSSLSDSYFFITFFRIKCFYFIERLPFLTQPFSIPISEPASPAAAGGHVSLHAEVRLVERVACREENREKNKHLKRNFVMNKERTLRIASDETNNCSSVLIIPVTIYLPFCQVIMEP